MVRRSTSWFLGLALLAGALPAGAQTAWSVRSDGGSSPGNFDDYLYSIDLPTGVATRIGPTGFEDLESLAFDPGCKHLYGVDDVTDQLVTCDTETGNCAPVGTLDVNVTDTGLAYARNGILYMSTDAPKHPTNLYWIDTLSGKATLLGDQGQEVTGLAGDLHGLYGLGGDNRNNLVRFDTISGAATPIGPLRNVKLSDGGLDFAADGTLWGISDASSRTGPSQVFTIDLATGTATVVANVREDGKPISGFEGMAIQDGICAVPAAQGQSSVVEVPTAGTWGLAALAAMTVAAGLFLLRRGQGLS